MKKRLLILLLLITAVSLVFAELMEPAGLLKPATNDIEPLIIPKTRGDAPEFRFHINPMSIMATYYDYFPGGYESIPLRLQPSPVGMFDGGGLYIAFQATPEAGGVRRVFHAYIVDGNITSQGLINSNAPASKNEGFIGIDIDIDTGNPFFAWHTAQDADPAINNVKFAFDQYNAIGFPGIFSEAYDVIRNQYTIDDEEGNEFIWPSVFVGPSPEEGKKRVYVIGKNYSQNVFEHPCENALITFADFEDAAIDLSAYDPEKWSVTTVPQLDRWRAEDVRTFRAAVISRKTGHIGIIGHSSELDVDDAFGEKDVMFVLENDNYGEGEWHYYETDPTFRIQNPICPETGVGFFVDSDDQPYQDMRYGPYVNRHNATVDDEGNYHFVALYSLSTEGKTWYPNLTTTRHIKFNVETEEFIVNDLYPRKEDGSFYIPWDDPPRWGESGGIIAPSSFPVYWWDVEDLFHENYHRIISDGPYMVALVQESLKARFYHEFSAEEYSSFAGAPETYIFLSNDYGESWSDPIIMNANPLDAEPDEHGYFHGHYVPEFSGMVPTYWYIADNIEMLDESWGRIHMMFLDQNDYGSSVQGNSQATGGTIMYTSMDLRFTPGDDEEETGVERDTEILPSVVSLNGNYPNPFNPTTTISYSVSHAMDVKLEIYNSKGQLIKTLVDGKVEAGENFAVWNGTSTSGQEVSSGVYFYKLTTEKESSLKKMLLVK